MAHHRTFADGHGVPGALTRMLTPRQHAAPTAIKALSRSAGMHKISYISTKRSGSDSRCNIELVH